MKLSQIHEELQWRWEDETTIDKLKQGKRIGTGGEYGDIVDAFVYWGSSVGLAGLHVPGYFAGGLAGAAVGTVAEVFYDAIDSAAWLGNMFAKQGLKLSADTIYHLFKNKEKLAKDAAEVAVKQQKKTK